MNESTFKALIVYKEDETGAVRAQVEELSVDKLPPGELLIEVHYSSVNYKDALALKAGGNIVKTYPHVPGIDLAGVVAESADDRFRPGDRVLVTGYDLGVGRYGGYSQLARVPSAWTVKLPEGLAMKESMTLGTAGFTAALSVMELQDAGVSADKGPVLVTGATGGVGSLAVAMLAKLGYETVASTGKEEMSAYLRELGASRVISREEAAPEPGRPLDKQTWAGVVDCVGGRPLATILSRIQYGGAAAISGLTGGTEVPTTVLPFILRGIRLIGIDSVQASMEKRLRVWELLSGKLKLDSLERISREIPLEHVPETAAELLQGKSQGRVVVAIGGRS